MKKLVYIIILVFATSITFAQKKEKIKGSKIVTVETKSVENFESLEVSDDIEVFLIKGTECGVEIEADDNLHQAIEISISGSILKLSATKNIISAKKFSVKVTYTDAFKSVTSRNNSKVNALTELDLDIIDFKSFDSSKLFLNVKSTNFNLVMDDKSKAELNLKSENTKITLSKNASLKALLKTNELAFDMYQKSEAIIEGDCSNLKLRLDNNANFTGKKLVTKTADLTTEGYTNASIQVDASVIIDAVGKSEIELYGTQKIEIKQFIDSAVLKKKPAK
jgi:hypothetical protein